MLILIYFRLTINNDNHAFSELSAAQAQKAIAVCDPARPCLACGLSVLQEQQELWLPLPGGGFGYQGIDYHVNDFVYIHNSHASGLLDIAQVMDFITDANGQLHELKVQHYGHYDHVAQQEGSSRVPMDNVSSVLSLTCTTNVVSEETL